MINNIKKEIQEEFKRKCKHEWEHEIELNESMNKELHLWLIHKCKKCGLKTIGERITK